MQARIFPVPVPVPVSIDIPRPSLASLCPRWQVKELALFGSVLRSDFRSDSDLDVLVTFFSTAKHSFFDLQDLQKELQTLFGRKVDLVDRRVVEKSENYLRRRHILDSAEVIYGP